jgi:CheY-like chemotaxis protein
VVRPVVVAVPVLVMPLVVVVPMVPDVLLRVVGAAALMLPGRIVGPVTGLRGPCADRHRRDRGESGEFASRPHEFLLGFVEHMGGLLRGGSRVLNRTLVLRPRSVVSGAARAYLRLMIGVLIADDHAIVRAGLCQLLATAADIDVLGTACNGEEAAELAGRLRPAVVLMDLSMPEIDGIEATRRIAGAGRPPAVVVLTTFSDRERICAALEAGAVGYLLKDVAPHELIAAIRAAACGELQLKGAEGSAERGVSG